MPVMLPNDIENETPADAVEVEENFNVIEQYTNANVITRDGTVAMAAPLQLFGDPVEADHAVRMSYVNAMLPIGVIFPYAGNSAPAGKWALCNGAAVQTSVYPKLFQVCQYRYGGSGGSFNLPDLRGRFPIGALSTDSRFNTTGDKGGAWDTKIPYHRHGIDHNHKGEATSNVEWTHSHGGWTSTTGEHRHSQNTDNAVGGDVGSRARGAAADFTGNFGGDPAGDHRHNIDPVTWTHKHTFDASLIDAWSAYAGTDGVDQVPPYLTLAFIIRVD